MPLRFLARSTAMVPRFDQPTKRAFAGRVFTAGAWPKTREPVAIEPGSESATEYVLAAMRGDLWPADADTADACGVKFDPKFGGDVELQPIPVTKDAAS